MFVLKMTDKRNTIYIYCMLVIGLILHTRPTVLNKMLRCTQSILLHNSAQYSTFTHCCCVRCHHIWKFIASQLLYVISPFIGCAFRCWKTIIHKHCYHKFKNIINPTFFNSRFARVYILNRSRVISITFYLNAISFR